jgi:hypothetical protein
MNYLTNVLPEKANASITLRNDNGSRFIAKSVRAYLKEINVIHEFAHITTKQSIAVKPEARLNLII